ncbi:WD40-repeat-containing domain protein [Circinella umbellata]|nr:WD40-repeat-containing domain protein [Circinella umbellata]
MEDKLKTKPRVHFGALDEQENAKRLKINEDGIPSLAPGSIDLDSLADATDLDMSESSLQARQADKEILEEFERRKRARQIAVPTDDARVRIRLRELGEPQCLFGEGPDDRRSRLRYLLSVQEGKEILSESDSEEEEKEEEFFTPGSEELLEARRWITNYSLPRARARIQKQNEQVDIPLAQVKASRKELHSKLKNYTNWASQIADERPVAQCAFTPDASMIVTGAWSGGLKLWSVPQGEEKMTFKGHTDRIGGIAFHPESTKSLDKSVMNFVTSGADSFIHLWSLDKETPLSTLTGHVGRVSRIAFHPSGKYLGSAGFDGTWRLWDIEKQNELLLQEGHSREVYAIAFQCDGSLVATGGLDCVGRVWDTRTGRSAMTCEGHVKDILGLDWSSNGYQLATASADNTVKIWDMRTLRNIYTISAHQSLVSDIKYSKDGYYLGTTGYDGCVKIWSGDDFRLIKSMEGHESKVMGIDISEDGRYLASCGFDRTFKLWADEDLVI